MRNKEFEIELNGVVYSGNWWFDYHKEVVKIEDVTTSIESDQGWIDCPINEPALLSDILEKVESDYEDDIAVEQEEAKWDRWNYKQECLRDE